MRRNQVRDGMKKKPPKKENHSKKKKLNPVASLILSCGWFCFPLLQKEILENLEVFSRLGRRCLCSEMGWDSGAGQGEIPCMEQAQGRSEVVAGVTLLRLMHFKAVPGAVGICGTA